MMSPGLEHNLFTNVSEGTAFLWQTQIQTINHGLYDMIRIKSKELLFILYSFTPSDINFQSILMPKVILAQFLSQKLVSLHHSYLVTEKIQSNSHLSESHAVFKSIQLLNFFSRKGSLLSALKTMLLSTPHTLPGTQFRVVSMTG